AEDGIRDLIVTGVQTCALPIFAFHQNRKKTGNRSILEASGSLEDFGKKIEYGRRVAFLTGWFASGQPDLPLRHGEPRHRVHDERSEERRVGKECRSGWWVDH